MKQKISPLQLLLLPFRALFWLLPKLLIVIGVIAIAALAVGLLFR